MSQFLDLLTEEEDLSDVDVEEGKMSDILGVPEEERIGDAYDGSAEDAAEELVDAVGEQEAAGMINYAANISGDSFLEDMQDALKSIDEQRQFREVVRGVIEQELSEMTTTAAGGHYNTPFAFGDEEDEKKEDDIEEFLDTYGWEMAELAKKAREEGLTEDERKKVKQYISKVRSMRDSDVESYRKKSNYYLDEEVLSEGRMEDIYRLADKLKDMAIEAKVKTRGSRPELYVGEFSPQHQVENLKFGRGITGKVLGKMIRAGDEIEFATQVAQALHDGQIRV
jgi:hypothetical protein